MNKSPTPNPSAPLQKIADTARITGLSQYYLRQGVKAGTIPYVRSGRVVYINVPALLELLNGQTALPGFPTG